MGRHLRATSCVQVEARCELRFKKYHLKTRRCRAQPISACAFLPTSNDAHSARGLGHPAGVMLGSETPLEFSCGPSGSVPEGCLGKQNGPFVPCEAEHGPEPASPHCAGAGALGIWAGRGARTGPGLATRVDSHLLGASPQRHYVPPGAQPGAGVWGACQVAPADPGTEGRPRQARPGSAQGSPPGEQPRGWVAAGVWADTSHPRSPLHHSEGTGSPVAGTAQGTRGNAPCFLILDLKVLLVHSGP